MEIANGITIAEPDRKEYAVLHKGLSRLEGQVAGRFAQTLGVIEVNEGAT